MRNGWKRISAGEHTRNYKGCVLRLVRERHGWVWSVTHTDFTLTDYCCTLFQAERAAVREANQKLGVSAG